jgi:hypothetical protein
MHNNIIYVRVAHFEDFAILQLMAYMDEVNAPICRSSPLLCLSTNTILLVDEVLSCVNNKHNFDDIYSCVSLQVTN